MPRTRLSRESHGLLLRQMDAKLEVMRATPPPTPPRNGWIQAIRTALGMSLAQLAVRLSMTDSGVRKLEESECQRTISLHTLDKVAEAMDCRVCYVLVPNTSLKTMREAQARRVAASLIRKAAHSMSLESQEVPADETERQIQEEAHRILSGPSGKLWQSR